MRVVHFELKDARCSSARLFPRGNVEFHIPGVGGDDLVRGDVNTVTDYSHDRGPAQAIHTELDIEVSRIEAGAIPARASMVNGKLVNRIDSAQINQQPLAAR